MRTLLTPALAGRRTAGAIAARCSGLTPGERARRSSSPSTRMSWHAEQLFLRSRSAALFRQPALSGAVVDVILWIDLPRRVFAGALFRRLGGDAGYARDDEERVGDLRRDADVAADGGDRAVDVDRQRPLVGKLAHDQLDSADHLDVAPFDLQFERHLKEPRGAGVAGMEPMPEPGDRISGVMAALEDRR